MTFEELESEALKLPTESRAELSHRLTQSLNEERAPDPEHERFWREEIERRCREIDEGRAELIPAEEVFQRAHAEEGGDPEVQRTWIEEAERRYQEFLEGKAESIPGEQAIQEVRAALRHR